MLDNLKSAQRKHIAFIGENAIDIVIYIAKICSFNNKILMIDLSSNRNMLEIVAPDGYPEHQNIRYAVYQTLENEIKHSYDLLIIYSDKVQNVPVELLEGVTFIFTTPSKNDMRHILKDINYIGSIDNIYLVCRGFDDMNAVKNRMYISGLPPSIIGNMFLINDTEEDTSIMIRMEYYSVFLYENLSMDLRKLMIFICNLICEMIDIACVPDEGRFKWVM